MSCPMSQSELTQTIVAIATPPGKGGIGILRLSGPGAADALARIYRGKAEVVQFKSHQLYLGRFLHPKTEELLDKGMAVWMRAPHSYTGEDVVEIHGHGGPLLLNRFLEVFLEMGLPLAEPGEFTRRAYLNGKMDLLQAEAVAELIHAQSEAALKNARAQLEGRLSNQVRGMRERLLLLLSRVEAAIDFPDEHIEILSNKSTLAELAAIQEELRRWLEQFALGRLIREGVRLVLVGRPNVGKSSLLNRLLKEDRAIVHHQPGTTRDVLEGTLHLGGVHFQVFDTAGIREGKEEVEREGIRRSQRAASQADLTLWVLDGSQALGEEDRNIGEALTGPVLPVANKSDLGREALAFPRDWSLFGPLFNKGWISLSALNGEGMADLEKAILKEIGLEAWEVRGQAYLNNARHRQALADGRVALTRAGQALAGGLPAECIAADLRAGTQALGSIVGEISPDEVLSKIFADFCIGK